MVVGLSCGEPLDFTEHRILAAERLTNEVIRAFTSEIHINLLHTHVKDNMSNLSFDALLDGVLPNTQQHSQVTSRGASTYHVEQLVDLIGKQVRGQYTRIHTCINTAYPFACVQLNLPQHFQLQEASHASSIQTQYAQPSTQL